MPLLNYTVRIMPTSLTALVSKDSTGLKASRVETIV